jgi:hypothetical protein
MPSIGSSSILRGLVIGNSTYITGPTGPTGPTGATGLSITGPTGPDGIKFESIELVGNTLHINYSDDNVFYIGVTGPSGSLKRLDNPNFIVSFTGASEFVNPFAGISLNDPYLFYFKTLKVVGEATAGISLDSIYIASPIFPDLVPPAYPVGPTGSLLYVNATNASLIDFTKDTHTKYFRSIISRQPGSELGITLDTFSFKESQDYITQFKNNQNFKFNWYNTTKTNIDSYLNSVDVTYSILPCGITGTCQRTDQSIFIFARDEDRNVYPKMSFRAEGITLYPTSSGLTGYTGPLTINVVGKGITYTSQTYSSSRIGSCCYCSVDAESQDPSLVQRSCIDYATQDFCNSINGNFSFNSCTSRYLTGDCYSGGACCVNGTCLETNKEFCEKVYGTFYSNIRCSELDGCPNTCSLEASCCVEGNCYSLPSGESSEQICRQLNGKYSEESCEDRNCCLDGFLGACCFGSTDCKDDYTPKQCAEENGFYQGAGSLCSASTCCKDTLQQSQSLNFQTQESRDINFDIKVGDYFEGGIVAGFVGYPPPSQFVEDLYFAKGEVISEIENYTNTSVSRYVAVNGVYNGSLKCNCSNFSPSRYITIEDLGKSNGKAVVSAIKSLSGVNDELNLTFYNRLTDACLLDEGKVCNFKSVETKKYGFNPVLAYKKLSQQIHGENVPSAWVLIVAPEDFGTENLSFGMSMSVNGYAVPSGFETFKDSLWQDMTVAPYGTSVFDGLVNTRLFDYSTIERNTWFIPSNYTLSGSLQTIDPLAYYRFKHPKLNYWSSDINQQLLTTNSEYFKEKYRDMWNSVNTETTALYQISNRNKNGYNGYSDWYIPSALELNIIYYNLNKINNGIVYNSESTWRTISNTAKYWTSTTGGKLTNVKNYVSGNSGVKTYEQYDNNLEGIITTGIPEVDSWRRYKLAQAHRAYSQNFLSGKMESILKTTRGAKLRACRMVPIYFKPSNLENQFEYSFKILNSCSSCR